MTCAPTRGRGPVRKGKLRSLDARCRRVYAGQISGVGGCQSQGGDLEPQPRASVTPPSPKAIQA